MTDPTLREDSAEAMLVLAETHLANAVTLTRWPDRHRLKQIQGDLADARYLYDQWADAQEPPSEPDTYTRHRDSITGRWVTEDETKARPHETTTETRRKP